MIELNCLSVIYRSGVNALDSVTLRFVRGQFTVILGSSGAGKPTLLRCLNGLIQPTVGTVRLEQFRTLRSAQVLQAHRQHTGMIFQNHHLIERQTALQNVLLGRLGYPAGAKPLQVIYHALLPQVWPQMMDLILYRWEYNFRASTVTGAVGAGGIGTELIGSLRVLNYQEVSAILLIILILVSLVDGISGYLRQRFS
jgi:ABC-type sugar transport system ATPase subunit